MDRFAVIGLGRFGLRLAVNLAAAGQEVIAIDRDLDVIDKVRDRVTLAIAIDATDEESLLQHGVDQVDVAVVSMRSNFEASTLLTVILKQIGVPRVVSRAGSPTSARILARIGADDVVNPEDESADRWSSRLVTPAFIDQFTLDARHSVVEIKTPRDWVGQSLRSLELPSKSKVLVVAVKTPQAKAGSPDQLTVTLPDPDRKLTENDTLILFGMDEHLESLPLEKPKPEPEA